MRRRDSICRILIQTFFVIGAFLVLSSGAAAQETGSVTANPLRLDLRFLGHPPLDVIPPGEASVTSLVVSTDGRLYGGTSGKKAHLFVLDPRWGHVFPLGFLPGEQSVFHSLAAAPDGSLYIGTCLPLRGQLHERGKDVISMYEGYSGGHIYRFNAQKERQNRIRMQNPDPNRPLPFIEDLGAAVPGEGIVCMIMGVKELCGVTFPKGHFFVTDLETGNTRDLGPICGPPMNEEPFRSIPRALLKDKKERIWGAGDNGILFHYNSQTKEIIKHPESRLPSVRGREFKTIVDALVMGPDGLIYGGTSDGFIFRFDPDTLKIVNLGKPLWQHRIRGLAFSQDGDLWGIGGDRGGAARLFVYRRLEGSYENIGLLHVNRMPHYAWMAFEAESMVAGKDGTLFIGEYGLRAHLFLLFPWK